MIDKQQILEYAQSNPKIQQAVDAIEQRIGTIPITPELINDIVQALELALENPENYPKIRQMAIEQGFADPRTLPEQFDPNFVLAMLVAFYELQARMDRPQQFARGGLARSARSLQAMGRGGDTILAHINPREAEVLKRMGGAGTVNPNTGLMEFKGGLGGILAAVAPIALSFIAPGLGATIGGMMGASGTAASMLGGAVLGGATSALGGGDFLKGAALGGLGAGGGSWLGGKANEMMGLGLGEAGQAALGSGIAGGVMGAATGGDPLRGALSGAAGQYLGSKFGAMGGEGAVGTGMAEAGKSFGNMMAAGYDPRTSIIGGGLSGIAAGLMNRPSGPPKSPSQTVLGGLKAGTGQEGLYSTGISDPGMTGGGLDPYSLTGSATTDMSAPNYELTGAAQPEGGLNAMKADIAPTLGQAPVATAAAPTGGLSSLLGGDNLGLKVMAGMQALSALQGAPEPVQQAVAGMSPAQQEYFNRPSVTWNWDQMQRDAATAGQDLKSYMAQNWNKVTAGTYNNPAVPRNLARGGALNDMVLGGRSDKIDAKLSPGEYVFDAETTALLGDGSSEAGAKKLDQMRSAIRSHKGKALARGKISPNAKSPLAYMKGVA